MIRWKHLSACLERKMKEIDVLESIEGEVEHDLYHVVIVDLDHVPLAADRRFLHGLVDLEVHYQREEHRDPRYRSGLVVALQSVDQEVAASLLAGIFRVLDKIRSIHSLFHIFSYTLQIQIIFP